jgi:hypothetical protein
VGEQDSERTDVGRGRTWSRRALLTAPVALGAGAVGYALTRERPDMRPLAAQAVHEGYGVCQHVNFQTSVYQHQAAIMERYGQMAVAQMRSLYVPGLANFDDAVDGARRHGVQWNATVAGAGTTQAEVEERIAHMAASTADLIGWVEGVNEPNEGSDWIGPCVERQKWIHDAVRSHPELDHVVILGPSMHDVRLANAGGAHWQELADAGIADHMDVCSVHSYPSASTPDNRRDERVEWVYDAFGHGYPIKFSEWGYTNSLGPASERTGGARPISPAASAIYDCQAVLDFANHGWEVVRYEFLDDPDEGSLDTESNYGLWEVGSTDGDPDLTWTPKPVVAPLTEILRSLRDPGESYSTTPVRLGIDAPGDVRTCLTQKRDGTTTLWLWRHVEVWDPDAEVDLDPGTVTVTVEYAGSMRRVDVGPMPRAVPIRQA